MTKIITFFNHKGGVGKTTAMHNLAVTLVNQGKKILLIDADPQMNLTSAILGFSDRITYNEAPEGVQASYLAIAISKLLMNVK